MKQWKEFFDYLLPDVPGCGVALATQALKLAAAEFCDKTLAWREWLDPVTTLANTRNYDFELTQEQQVVQFLACTLAGRNVDLKALPDLPSDWATSDNVPRCAFTVNRKEFYLLPPQSAGQIVLTEVALRPSDRSTGLPDDLFEHYREEIAKGAKYRLMTSPKKPWTELQLGMAHREDFFSRCSAIAWEVARSHSNTQRRSKAHTF